MKAHYPFYEFRTARLDKFLTHYVVVVFEGEQMAVGEAGGVQKIGSDEWYAFVANWYGPPGSCQVDTDLFGSTEWTTVRAPMCKLVEKEQFKGFVP